MMCTKTSDIEIIKHNIRVYLKQQEIEIMSRELNRHVWPEHECK